MGQEGVLNIAKLNFCYADNGKLNSEIFKIIDMISNIII